MACGSTRCRWASSASTSSAGSARTGTPTTPAARDGSGPRQLVSMGWGPVARSRGPASLWMALLLASAAVVLVRRDGEGDQRCRAVALGCFFGGALVLELLVGYGPPASCVRRASGPLRPACPALFAAWFALAAVRPARVGDGRASCSSSPSCSCSRATSARGTSGATSTRAASRRSVTSTRVRPQTRSPLATATSLMHWNHEYLARSIELLREERTGPFAEAAPNRKAR